MALKKHIRQFFFPSLTLKFLIRAALVTLLAYLFFSYICIPIRIKGFSMEPTYHNGSINFCYRLCYLFTEPERHDVVVLRFAGNKVTLLKRIIALEGEIVEFCHGKLLVDGKEIAEPYIHYPCNWNLPPRQVEDNCVYVVGDNRSIPMENHDFGQTPIKRIIGAPLW